MADYEGKSERDILIELYLKMQQLEQDIQQLNNNFADYKLSKSIRIREMEAKHNSDMNNLEGRLDNLNDWKNQTVGTWKGVTILATALGVVGTILGGIAVFIL